MDSSVTSSRLGTGLTLALLSAFSFGLSGTLATGLLQAGWTPLAAVTLRVAIGAVLLAWPAVRALQGNWTLVRTNAPSIIAYGLLAVAGAQLCYFQAVQYLPVATALLVEYLSPLAVMAFLWASRGQRPALIAGAGAVVAVGGLTLVLEVASGTPLDPVGVAWSLGAMVGAAAYFLISAETSGGLPPLALAGGGLAVGTLVLALAGAVGMLPLEASTAHAVYAGRPVPWWVPVLALGLVTAAFAYATGIAAARRLGSRVASFVALSEVLVATVVAAAFVGQVPGAAQAAGAVLVVGGVILVKLGESRLGVPAPGPGPDPEPARDPGLEPSTSGPAQAPRARRGTRHRRAGTGRGTLS